MKPSKYDKISMLRTITFVKTRFLFLRGLQQLCSMKMEDNGCMKIEEANCSDYSGRSCITRVTKNGKTNNTEYKAHMQHHSYYKAVSMGTDYEEN